MGLAFESSSFTESAIATTGTSVSLPQTTALNDVVVVAVMANANSLITISGAGATWVKTASAVGTSPYLSVFYGYGCSAGNTSITVTAAAALTALVELAQLSGNGTSDPCIGAALPVKVASGSWPGVTGSLGYQPGDFLVAIATQSQSAATNLVVTWSDGSTNNNAEQQRYVSITTAGSLDYSVKSAAGSTDVSYAGASSGAGVVFLLGFRAAQQGTDPYLIAETVQASGVSDSVVLTVVTPTGTTDGIHDAIAVYGSYNSTGTSRPTAVTDSRTNSYTSPVGGSTDYENAVFVCLNPTPLQVGDTIMLTFGADSDSQNVIAVGIPGATAVDQTIRSVNSGSTAPSATTGALAQSSEVALVFIDYANGGAFPPAWGSGIWQVAGPIQSASNQITSAAYIFPSSTSALTMSATLGASAKWTATVVTFKVNLAVSPTTAAATAAGLSPVASLQPTAGVANVAAAGENATAGDGSYTAIYPTSGPSAATSYSGDFGCAIAFEVTEPNCWLQGFWWWVCATGGQSTAPQDFCLWQATGDDAGSLVPGSEITSGTLEAGWNWVPFSTAIPLTPGVSYRAVTAFTGPFPDTNSEFGSGDPYSAGITNGPLNVYGDGTGGGTNLDPWNNAQGSFQTSSSDPTAGFPTNSYESANFWIDVQVTQTAPSGADNRMWPNTVNPIGAMAADSDTTGYMLATGFELSGAASLAKIWFFSGSGAVDLPTKCAIWDSTTNEVVSGSENDSPTWSGAAGSGWVSCSYTGVSLVSGRPYFVGVYFAGGGKWYAAMVDFWNTAPWSAGLGCGLLSSEAIVGATPSAYASTWEYPTTAGSTDEVYFVDAEVTPASGGTNAPAGVAGVTVAGLSAVPALGSPASDANVTVVSPSSAGHASVPAGEANVAAAGLQTAFEDAPGGLGGVTVAADAPTPAVGAQGTVGAATAGAAAPVVELSVTPSVAGVTVAALAPTVGSGATAQAGVAGVTVAADNPTIGVKAAPTQGAVTAGASGPTPSSSAGASVANVTVATPTPTADGDNTFPVTAAATAAALEPVVGVKAPAGVAGVTVAGLEPTAGDKESTGVAAATAAALSPTPTVGGEAGIGAASAGAYEPGLTIRVTPGVAGVTAAALSPVGGVAAPAQRAAVAVAALGTTAAVGGQAAPAAVAAAALPCSSTIVFVSGSAAVLVAGLQPTATIANEAVPGAITTAIGPTGSVEGSVTPVGSVTTSIAHTGAVT